MEDLAPYQTSLPARQSAAQLQAFNSVARALGRVKIKLTAQQFRSLAHIVVMNLSAVTGDTKGLFLLSDIRQTYLLSQKLQRKMLSVKGKLTLSLDMSEAAMLWMVLDSFVFASFAEYERNLVSYIMGEIDKQTV